MEKNILLILILLVITMIIIFLAQRKTSKKRLQSTIDYFDSLKKLLEWFDNNPDANKKVFLVQKRIEEEAFESFTKTHGYK